MTRLRSAVLLASVVLFTLALGIALGGGPLQAPVQSTLQNQVEAVTDDRDDIAALIRRNRDLSQSARFDRGFADALATDLLGERLAGRSVLVLSLPGVADGVTDRVVSDVETAGGSVTSSLRVGPDLVDPTARPLVDELSRRLLADLDGLAVPAGASVYTRTGVLAADALLTGDDGGAPLDDADRSVFNTLATARLLRGAEPQQRADAAVVLLPSAPQRTPMSSGRGLILTDLVAAIDEGSDGVVVAGPPSAAGRHGLLEAVRTSASTAETVSTVDSTDRRSGQVVTALALAEQVAGDTAHYGVAAGADALVPPGAGSE